jgi:hypothetical protein
MKKNLIKTLLLLFVLQLQLGASTYEWKASINKEKAYVNEAIYLKYVCEFSDRAELYAVEFNPVKSNENMTVVMLSETSKIEDGRKRLLYEFVAFVHKASKASFEFETLMKKTTKESIENTVIGRDNGKYAEYQIKKLKQKKLTVDILETPTPLVGSLKMDVKKDKPEIKSLTPYHLELKIKGIGDFEALQALDFDMKDVKVFSEKPMRSLKLTQNGYQGEWSQKFAFVSEKAFTINPISIDYFDPVSHEEKNLRFDGVSVNVLEGYKPEELLDDVKQNKYIFKWEYLYYLFTFIAGYLIAQIKFKRKSSNQEDGFCKKVKNANSLDELSILLIMKDSKKYDALILQIQNGELTSLQKSKKLICG